MEESVSVQTRSLLSSADADSKDNLLVQPIWTDEALDELKKQSPEGCLLCSIDAWDEEEWD